MELLRNHQVYDTEIYPNLFTVTFKPLGKAFMRPFEISERRDQREEIVEYVKMIDLMIGFNNLGFDWLLIKALLERPNISVFNLYELADLIIKSDSRFGNIDWNPSIPQLDLFRLHHFDNRAKQTSLKTLEFNMRMRSIQDLPFPPGTFIKPEDIDTVLVYNGHDVIATEKFHGESLDKINLRMRMNPKWLNYSDSKIGKQYFIDALQNAGVDCYYYDEQQRRRPRQTPREDGVRLNDIIFPWIEFNDLDLQLLLSDLKEQTITDTNGSFDRKFEFGGLKTVFGLGGLHGSVNRRKYTDGTILDLDVTSYYPSIAFEHGVYPAHLGPKFCEIYRALFERRKTTKKGSDDNQSLKLALNSVFGDSGNPYGPFFDPAYMLAITVNGQLMILKLAEMLSMVEGLEFIQINTDGVTIYLPPEYDTPKSGNVVLEVIASNWQRWAKMQLEEKQYRRLFIRDVNNYIGEFMDGERKRKGAYEYERDWHQNHSGLVIPKGAEAVLLNDEDPETFVILHPDNWDFMFRVKCNRGTRVEFENGQSMTGTIRYYLSQNGMSATKIMPKTRTRLHASAFAEPDGKRGNWNCPECGFTSKRKVDVQAHMESCHSSKLMLAQVYDGQPIDIDPRPYINAIIELTRNFT